MAEPAPSAPAFSFVEMEHRVLDFWNDRDVFQKSLERTSDGAPYVFYDGPPFATGLPHHGHIVASTIKDIVPRYWTMKGRHVPRRFGWDCHGLPIEHEIDKQLNMSAKQAVEELGIAGYNKLCRSIVSRYVSEWRNTITRLGRWVDFDNDYKTMDAWFMESVWWVVKQLWDRGLVYQGFKVMPLSTELGTPLSNFEANSNYMDVQDPAITVLFRLLDDDAWLAAWTTTPWTLPSNLGICVGPDVEYVKVRDTGLGRDIWFAAERVEAYGAFEVLERSRGRDLVGRRYEPLFPYFAAERERGAFTVVMDDYVTADSGTGIVHQAPAFGEDDFRVMKAAGIAAFVCPVTLHGEFTDEVPDFAGRNVKDADKDIIRYLKDHGTLYRHETIQHSYPFCYRSDTPLIYRAIPSWYVSVTQIVDRMLAANEQIRWVPDHIKRGRFGNWLAGAIDWSISRNRVWGTPIPIWINDVTGNRICIGSVDELASRTGVRVSDLHREYVDPLTFRVEGEAGTYRRIEEVLDCWFESGSMPYAQLHYPFENVAQFEAGFPAEFIAEGLDQTRGWFYTLTVLAAALYDKPAFRNVIVNGMVMAEDGKKMSKRLRNYTPPEELMEVYGADALRLYLINSGLVRGEEQRFADAGVRDIVRRALLPWYNAYSFLRTYAQIDEWSPSLGLAHGDNILDRWILSRLQSLKADVAEEMDGYRLFNVVPPLLGFIDELTNWYIRLNRGRFWASGMTPDKQAAYATLFVTLQDVAKLMAPFAPFLAEHLYRELAALGGGAADPESVHLCTYPEADRELIRPELERAVDRMQQVILLGRQKREEVRIGLRTPLRRLTVINRDESLLADLRALEPYVRAELNVQSIAYDSDEDAWIEVGARPNFPRLGKRLGKRMKAFQALIGALAPAEIAELQQTGSVEIDGERFDGQEIEVVQQPRPGTHVISNRYIAIDLDTALDDELVRSGYAREIVNRIQRYRKDLGLNVADRIRVKYTGDPELLAAAAAHAAYISAETLATSFERVDALAGGQESAIDDRTFRCEVRAQAG
jgi:isoleucyl-tRNA synthetase